MDIITGFPEGAKEFFDKNFKSIGWKGKSKCHKCGKINEHCWDTVCSLCNKTFCYKHSIEKNGRWYCEECGGIK